MATSTGLILGKFMPVHAGHRYLIDAARARVDRLTVVVCTLEREPIPGDLRYGWMKSLYPDVNVVHLTDELPQEPHEHPDFWALWTAALKHVHPEPISTVFGSEDYVLPLASCLDAAPIVVDRDREHVPISATMIRADPMVNWDYIPPPVRPYFVRRVCILGTESTGKTTLAATLAAHYNTVWAPEYARAYIDEEVGAVASLSVENFEQIVRGQWAGEERLAREANRVLISDTDIITTMVYAYAFLGTCPDWIVQAAAMPRYDLYLLTTPDVPWVWEDQRTFGHRRAEMQARFAAALDERAIPYTLISGDWAVRERTAIAAIEGLLSGHVPGARTRH